MIWFKAYNSSSNTKSTEISRRFIAAVSNSQARAMSASRSRAVARLQLGTPGRGCQRVQASQPLQAKHQTTPHTTTFSRALLHSSSLSVYPRPLLCSYADLIGCRSALSVPSRQRRINRGLPPSAGGHQFPPGGIPDPLCQSFHPLFQSYPTDPPASPRDAKESMLGQNTLCPI